MKHYTDVHGSQAERPSEIDTKSSPTTVYIRKNIRREDEFWVYDEQQYSLREYIALQGESINLLQKVAEKMIYQALHNKCIESEIKNDFTTLANIYLNQKEDNNE